MINILLSNVYVLEDTAQYGMQQAWIWFLIPVVLALAAIAAIKIGSSPSPETRSIVIAGSVASGKTTLWQQLRNIIPPKDHVLTDDPVPIESFDIKIGDRIVRIESTMDLGGTDYLFRDYDKLIKEGTFVYFLVDLTRIEDKKNEIRARIQKIAQIITDNGYKHCGIKLLATFYDEYASNNNYSKSQAVAYVKQTLEVRTIKDIKVNIDECILAVNLLDKSDIEIIKNEILNIKK